MATEPRTGPQVEPPAETGQLPSRGVPQPDSVATLRTFDSEKLGHRVQALGISNARALSEVRDILASFMEKVGFQVGVVAVRRADDHLQPAVLLGTDLTDDDLIRMVVPPESWRSLFEEADLYGKWSLRRGADREQAERSYFWVPDTPAPEGPDAWHPLDGLNYPICDSRGTLVGSIGLDVPVDGRVPSGEERWGRLNDLAVFASAAISAILERERQAERARFAEAAQAVLRRTAADVPPLEALRQAGPGIEAGLSLDEVACYVFPSPAAQPSEASSSPAGVRHLPRLLAMAESALIAAWRDGTPALEVHPQDESSLRALVGDADHAVRYAAEVLAEFGVRTAVAVPIGAAGRCFGGLLVVRTSVRAPWSEDEVRAVSDLGHDLGRSIAAFRTQERERDLVADMQRLTDYKNRLVAAVSHDLVSPISAIRLHLDLLEQTGAEAALVPHAVTVMQRATQELLHSVDGLLTLYRADAVRTPHERIDLRTLLQDATDLHRPIAVKASLELIDESPSSERVHVRGSRAELSRVLANLIGNAVKYTPDGTVAVALTRRGQEAVLQCRDTGIGMAPADRERIFEEFFRSQDPQLRDVPGTGLGMSIVARIVRTHGGEVSVESTLGEGTTVEVRLPMLAGEPDGDLPHLPDMGDI